MHPERKIVIDLRLNKQGPSRLKLLKYVCSFLDRNSDFVESLELPDNVAFAVLGQLRGTRAVLSSNAPGSPSPPLAFGNFLQLVLPVGCIPFKVLFLLL